MHDSQNCKRVKIIFTNVLLTVLLAGCATNTAQYFGNSPMKMAHQTIILDDQTHRSVTGNSQNSSSVIFEYEEIIMQ